MEKHKQDSESIRGRDPSSGGPVTDAELDRINVLDEESTKKDLEDRLYWIQVAMDGYTTRTTEAEQTYDAIKGIVLYGVGEVQFKEEDDGKEKTEEGGEADYPGTGFGEELLKEFQKRHR